MIDCADIALLVDSKMITLPRCYINEVLKLEDEGIRIIDASCADGLIWVEDECVDDMLALGYENVRGGVFKAMSNTKEDCNAE